MPFERGNNANPGGKPKEKKFTDALRIAVSEEVTRKGAKTTKLRIIADGLVRAAMKGEGWAIQQVADRLEGKPAQAIIGGDDGDPAIRFERIVRTIVRPPDPNG